MPTIRIGLTSKTAAASFKDIQRVAKALDIQVKRDLGPIWSIDATVEPLEHPGDLPPDMLPIFIVDNTPGMVGGLHAKNGTGRPFANVLVSREDWGLSASHECVELLIDPTGARMLEGRSLAIVDGKIQDGPDRVNYVVEACDPVEDPAYSYKIGDVAVTDFYTPEYFDDVGQSDKRYSHKGFLTRPREIKPNGYLSWINADKRIQQLRWFGKPAIFDLPDHTGATTQDGLHPLSPREFIDRHVTKLRQKSAPAHANAKASALPPGPSPSRGAGPATPRP